MSTALLSTKLFTPPARDALVARPRLLARLDAALRPPHKLTLVCAPAGFGKTTLLSAWLASRSPEFAEQAQNVIAAWVSLDAADSDLLRFWSYVVAALDTLQPGSGTSALALLQSPQPPPIEAVLAPLLNTLSSLTADAALILDDYHAIDAPSIHSTITFLLDHLPPRLHLVLACRADPPLALSRLRARGQLTELRAADLRFTVEECTAFLTELMGIPLSGDDVEALDERTEGWAAGLQFAALAMQNHGDLAGFIRGFTGSHRFVVDYLAEEVIDQLPTHLQTFLLKTSILDRMCGPLCDAVLGLDAAGATSSGKHTPAAVQQERSGAYSQLILEQLERANLFLTPLDDERRWYRYHHLFAEVLRARLLRGASSAEIASLHQHASSWYEAEGLIGEAIRVACHVGDIERAATLIERHGLRVLFDLNDVFLVRTWIERLPHELITSRPRLTIIAGFILALSRQFDTAERLLQAAAPAFGAPALTPNSLGELAVLHSTLARLRFSVDTTHTWAQQALAQLDKDNGALRALAFLNIGIASLERGEIAAANTSFADALTLSEIEGEWIGLAALEEIMYAQSRQGQIKHMLASSEALITRSARRGAQRIPAAGIGYVGVAEVLFEWNDLDGAMRAATQAVELLRRGFERLLIVRAYLVLARVHLARGNEQEALASVRQCEEWFVQNGIPPLKNLALICAYQLGPLAPYHVPETVLEPVAEQASLDEFEASYVRRLILARAWLAQCERGGDELLAKTLGILEQVLTAVDTRGWGRYQLRALLLLALTYQKRGERTQAQASLERALLLAEPDGYVRTFVDEGAPMAALLGQVARTQSPTAPYAAKLLAAFPNHDTMIRRQGDLARAVATQTATVSPPELATTALLEPLSTRELEILHLIAAGHSNQAIADTLVIAVSTVKRHINNIYGKLAVQSRTQALARARELGLL